MIVERDQNTDTLRSRREPLLECPRALRWLGSVRCHVAHSDILSSS